MMQSFSMRSFCHVALSLAVMAVTPRSAAAEECAKVLGLHGFKATAQVVCHFGQRENEALDWARSCARHQDPETNTRQIRVGAEVFQATAVRMGESQACKDVLGRFRGVLFER